MPSEDIVEKQRYHQAAPHKNKGVEACESSRGGVKEKSAHAAVEHRIKGRFPHRIAHGTGMDRHMGYCPTNRREELYAL